MVIDDPAVAASRGWHISRPIIGTGEAETITTPVVTGMLPTKKSTASSALIQRTSLFLINLELVPISSQRQHYRWRRPMSMADREDAGHWLNSGKADE